MKPTSIISLIVAFLLVVTGLVTCFIAQNIASANGEFIFAESRGDDLVYLHNLYLPDIINCILPQHGDFFNYFFKPYKNC